MAGSMDVIEFVAREALTNEDKFKRLVAQLGDSSRRNRQNAAGSLAFIAKVSPELLVPHASDLVDALNRPEAQTRWESLDALTALVPVESRCTDKALAGAENALFDEDLFAWLPCASSAHMVPLPKSAARTSGRLLMKPSSAITAMSSSTIC